MVAKRRTLEGLQHCPTGIDGLDTITAGGLPRGRTTLVAGSAGAGKTLLATEFVVRGVEMGEPGVIMTFEETADELSTNVASLGWDLPAMCAAGHLVIDHVKMERDLIEQTGDYDLAALFVRLGYAIESVGAKRVVLDTLEVLFSALDDSATLRAELRRMFSWLKDKGVTSIVTAERGEGELTRHGLEEYVSDCVITLDNRVV
ncbi:MAG TPA: ATPase domain-containing protein, partial [Acidimicrobiales bacterium]|nr:ATPase domain-containing protein [Acidimicrobiales bacterium]